ncbi:unnamed protein product [Schistosoma turkestanicum]|nr:unnamed protein product [Schistosoma turkestanicum]
MKTPKSKHKKATSETDESQPIASDQLFSIISLSSAQKFMNNLENDICLKLAIQTHLEETNLILQRPNLTLINTILKIDSFKQQYQEEPMSLINNNNSNQMEPKTSLWDAALINYFTECIKWSTTKWIEEFYKRKSNSIGNRIRVSMFQYLPNNNINESNEIIDMEKLMCIIISFTTAYILLRHLQLWHLANEQFFLNKKNDNFSEKTKTTCLVASIQFFKSLFQLSIIDTIGDEHHHYNTSVEKNLYEFEKQFSGYLSIVELTAAELLIEFFSRHFLNKHNLLERAFGPYTACNQRLIKISCPLYFDTLLETFETSSDSIWPAPLSEAISLRFISKYSELFPEKVTKWLKIIKPVETPKGIEQQQQQQQNEQSISLETEIQISLTTDELKQEEFDSMFNEKYLTSIDTLNLSELNAITQVNQSELDSIVQKLLTTELSLTFLNKDYLIKIKEKQIELGKQLIERAKIKIAELEQSSKINK